MRNGKRGRYTLEFELEAVRLVESGDGLDTLFQQKNAQKVLALVDRGTENDDYSRRFIIDWLFS